MLSLFLKILALMIGVLWYLIVVLIYIGVSLKVNWNFLANPIFPLWLIMAKICLCAYFLSVYCLCMHAKSLQLCLTLHDPMDCSLPGSSVHGILLARILEWVAMPSSRGSSWRRNRTRISYISCMAGRFITTGTTREALKDTYPVV